MRRRRHISRRHVQFRIELTGMRTVRAIFLASRRPHGKRPRSQPLQPLRNFFARFGSQPDLIKCFRRNDKERRHRKCRRQLGQRRALAARNR